MTSFYLEAVLRESVETELPTALQAGYAIFAAAIATEDITVRIGAYDHTLAAGSTQEIATAANWLTTCHLAFICRDTNALETLMNAEVEANPQVDLLMSYLRRGRSTREKADDPTSRALRWFLGNQSGLFNEALQEALDAHGEGLALGPVAVACLAHDQRHPITVESERLPKDLLEREPRGVTEPVPGKKTWFLVDRHAADLDVADREGNALTEQLTELIAKVEQDPTLLQVIGAKALEETGYHLINDEQGSWSHTWFSFALAMQAYTGIFAVADAPKGRYVRLRDDEYYVPATGPHPQANAENWLKAMFLAMICRDRDRIKSLALVSLDLLRASGVDHDEAVYEWVRVLQNYWWGGSGVSTRWLEAMPQDDDLFYPPIEVFMHLADDNQAGFTDSLARALRKHREHWTKTAERAQDPNGFLALAPLAMAARAQEAGWINVTVRSPYLPLTLQDGGRVGEGGPL